MAAGRSSGPGTSVIHELVSDVMICNLTSSNVTIYAARADQPLQVPTYPTRLLGVCPASTASIPSSTRWPIASRVRVVALPRCGSNTTFSSSR